MNNPIKLAQQELEMLLNDTLIAVINDGKLNNTEIPTFIVEMPSDKSNGDFATNIALVGAKAFRMAPIKIAQIIVENINLENTLFKKVEIAGPGFINFFVKDAFYEGVIKSVYELQNNYGKTDFGAGKRILLEYVSANPTGPMHIGNARGGAIGDSLATVMSWAGYFVNREFYVNDAGNQINKFALSLEYRYLQIYDETIEISEDCYLGEDITEHANNFNKIYGDKYLNVTAEERRKALVDYALPLNINNLKEDLLKYRIEYDNWFLESTLHKDDGIEKIIKLFKDGGHTYEEDGALWFRATDFGNDKDFVLLRSNGIPTYVVPDIMYHYNKLIVRGFDTAINVLGADHHGYIPRLSAALQALGIDKERFSVVLIQMVNLVRDGKIIKASKRSGKAITLVTLLEEVPLDAARFFFNMIQPNTTMDFDLSLAIENNSSNPVYYVQYAHARICSILNNLKNDGVLPLEINNVDLSLLQADEEKELIKFIATFPNVIIESAKGHEPSKMAKYAIEIATLFHKFYNACRVKVEDEKLMQARLALCNACKVVLFNVLSILSIDAPTSM